MNLDVTKFLEDVTGRYAKPHYEAIHALYVALVTGDKVAAFEARQALAKTMGETMGLAEMMGAAMTLRAAAGEKATHMLALDIRSTELLAFAATPVQSIVPRVTFEEALQDIVSRTPVVLRDAAQRTAQNVAKVYAQGHVMVFVRAVEMTVAREAKDFIARAFKAGLGEVEAGRGLADRMDAITKETAAWSQAYSRMVFRTTVNTATTSGRFRQARDQDIREAVPAFRFDAVGDSDTRHNHGAADGVIMSTTNPEWGKIAPPLGYNCRCQVSHVTAYELSQRGRLQNGVVVESRVPPGAYADPGFRHGPASFLR